MKLLHAGTLNAEMGLNTTTAERSQEMAEIVS